MKNARQICREEDDCGFIRNYLDGEGRAVSRIVSGIVNRDLHAIREAILAPKFNFGAPCVSVSRVGADGSLALRHDYLRDGRGLDLQQAERVVEYVERIWRCYERGAGPSPCRLNCRTCAPARAGS